MKAKQRASAPVSRVTERFPVEGLDCQDCGDGARAALRRLPGVQAVAVNVGAQEIAVTFDPGRVDGPAIRAQLASAGLGCRG